MIISTNTEVPAAQLSKLSFIPPSGWYGSTDFSWTASDGRADSTMPAEVHLYYPYSSLQIFIPSVMKSFPPVFTQNFEGDFPGAWQMLSYTNNSSPGYDVTDLVSWGKRDCHAASGKYGGWAVGGGSLGGSWSCTDGYPDNITTWMTYGPIDLSQVKDGWMSMKIWTNVEYNYDRVGWGVSLDNDMFYGRTTTGYGDAWLNDAIDLKNIYVLGDVTGHSQVWIGIWFDSDSYYAPEQGGAAVDDFSFTSCLSSTCPNKPLITGTSHLPDTLLMMPISMEMHKAGLLPASLSDAKMLNDPTLEWLKKVLKP
jgi:hypothetical protein